jgi:Bacterial lectin
MKTNLFAILSLAVAVNAHAATFNYPDFSSTSGLTLVGSAAQNGSFVRLTPNTQDQYGAMWYNTPQFVAGGFTTTFQFRISNQVFGGDGIAFALQNVGNNAAGMEYGAFSNNIGITLNTFFNGGMEPSGNFVGIVTNTDEFGHAFYQSTYDLNGTPINLKDGNIHSATLSYSGQSLSMLIDGVSIFSNVQLALGDATDQGGNSFVGFGARTGLATENHDILSWSFTNVPEPGSAAIFTLGSVVLGWRLFRRKNRSRSLRC